MADFGSGLVGAAPEVSGYRRAPVEAVAGEGGGGEQAADRGEAVADQRVGGAGLVVVGAGRGSFPRLARVMARKAWASMLMVTWRCQGSHLRTW